MLPSWILDLEIWSKRHMRKKREQDKKEEKEITVPAPKDSTTKKIIFGGGLTSRIPLKNSVGNTKIQGTP